MNWRFAGTGNNFEEIRNDFLEQKDRNLSRSLFIGYDQDVEDQIRAALQAAKALIENAGIWASGERGPFVVEVFGTPLRDDTGMEQISITINRGPAPPSEA